MALAEDVFLFVNTRSGGKRGTRLLEQVPQPFRVPIHDESEVLVRAFDISEGPSGKKPGFLVVKEQSFHRNVRVAVAGGDGTILWAVEEASKTGCDVSRLLFAIIPLGTGNDFSRFTGWGGSAPSMRRLFRRDCEGMKNLVKQWMQSRPRLHDIWRIRIQVDASRGAILVNSGGRKKTLEEKLLEKSMHSYCSMGWDARAGMEQEKWRTSSRIGNLFNYGLQICAKGLPCRQKCLVADFTRSLHHGTSEADKTIFQGCKSAASSSCCISSVEETDFLDDSNDKTLTPKLLGNPEVLVFLNIPNCYSGLCKFWQHAYRNSLVPADEELLKLDQDAGDGKLEVVTYDNVFQTVSAACTPAGVVPKSMSASRVFSGAPIFCRFNEADLEDHMDVHVQIDGEFFKLQHPEFLAIQRERQIKVLHSSLISDTDSQDEEEIGESDLSDDSYESDASNDPPICGF